MQARHRAELDALLKEMQGATASHEEETQQLVLLTSLDSTLVAEGVVDSPGESVVSRFTFCCMGEIWEL